MFPAIRTFGAIVYLVDGWRGEAKDMRQVLERIFSLIGMQHADVQASLFRTPFHQGRWRKKLWPAFDEAMGQHDVEVLDLLVGTPMNVRFTAKIQLRKDPDPRRSPTSPLHITFACESQTWPEQNICAAARSFLENMSCMATPISGAIFSAPTFGQAMHEMHMSHNIGEEPKPFQDRIGFDMRLDNYWTKARRLYPITLLGPKLASQVSASDALAAGALAVQEINGSLLIDAYPTVVETWDPEYLKATVNLRKWLWPHTIQNPADAAGLGLKLPKR
jgi:hypothetical protein